MYEGNVLCHYSFCDSSINAMIQLSDYIVGILRKYFIFLDRLQQEVDADIDSFDKVQMKNFQLLNKTLNRSLLYNPLFINTIISIHCWKKMELYINKYGKTWTFFQSTIFPDFVTPKNVFYNWLINNSMYLCVTLFWGMQKFLNYVYPLVSG